VMPFSAYIFRENRGLESCAYFKDFDETLPVFFLHLYSDFSKI
jgi:hypothetical protein